MQTYYHWGEIHRQRLPVVSESNHGLLGIWQRKYERLAEMTPTPVTGSDRLLDRLRYRRSISTDGDKPMTILSKLTLSDKTKAAMLTSPEIKLRGKMLGALDLQIEAAKANLNGETFIRRAMRRVDDPETGERVRKEVPVRFRTWFWKDEQGNTMLEVRYGNKRLELNPKKSTVEVGEAEKLIPTLETLREAVNAGELDKLLKEAKSSRKFGKGR